MLKILVVDSSSLIALDRVGLLDLLGKVDYAVLIPQHVYEEVKINKSFINVKKLNGRTLNIAKKLKKLNIGDGEAECCALALSLKLEFIVCDDNKFIKTRFYLGKSRLLNLKILGFSFLLHLFYKNKLIDNVWDHFNNIIKLNNWERSVVQVTNYTFLKQLGY